MKRKLLTLTLTIMLSGIPSFYVNADDLNVNSDLVDAKEMLEQGEYKSRELIVIFKDNVSDRTINNVVTSEDASCKDIIAVDDNSKASIVKISSSDSMEEAIEKFKDNTKVEYVQPNYKYSFYEGGTSSFSEPKYQYHLENLKMKQIWEKIESGSYNTTKVSVIDTGVDVYHEDLQANLVNTDSYIATIGGKQLTKDYDMDEHGTHVSGIIGATYGNNLGVSGVASGTNNDLVKVMMVGSTPDGRNLYTADIIEAINYSKDNGAKVINMSFGGEGRDRAMEAAIKDAYDSGIVLVAAAGNDGIDVFSSPSDFKEVISVNASNKFNNVTYWSDYGNYKDITAPGNDILSTIPGDSYASFSGTSMASPVIAGIVALMLDVNPDLTPAQVYNILCASTGSNSFDEYAAYGVVNAEAAIDAVYNASVSEPVTELTIKNNEAEVYENDNIYLETLVKPATSLKSVSWSSDDESIATVDNNGKVTGVSQGTTTVRATVDGKEVTCEVLVKLSKNQSSITIENKDALSLLVEGETRTLTATILPENATNKEVYWKSSNRNVIDIDENGNLVAMSSGTAIITAKTYDGAYTDSVTIQVVKDPKKITMSNTVSKMLIGDKHTYSASVKDEDGNDLVLNNQVKWRSTNTAVAKVSQTGEVTAVGAGTTYIVAYVKTVNNSFELSKSSKLIVGKTNYSGKDYGLVVAKKYYNNATLSWNEIPVASSYIIERSTSANGTYTVVKTLTAGYTSYKDKNLDTGKTYYYRIKAKYNDSKMFSYSSVVSAKLILMKPVLKINNSKVKKLVLSWKAIPGANGYEVYRATSSSGSYKKIKTLTATSFTNTKLKSKKKYYYKVRAYRTVNGKKVYSSYSKIIGKVVK